jgi:ankyrin repeat protein
MGLMERASANRHYEVFHAAIRKDDVDTVRALLDVGLPPDATISGITPLSTAASSGVPRMIDLLIEAGADPNQRMDGLDSQTFKFRTALNVAAYGAKLDCVERLLAGGAEPRSLADDGGTAGHTLLHGVASKGAHIVTTPSGASTVDEDFARRLCSILTRMMEAGLPVNQQDKDWNTMLDLAIARGMPSMVLETLLDHGANPYCVDKQGHTALHTACLSARTSQLETLIARGVDINFPTVSGKHALNICTTRQIFEAVLAARPNLEYKDHVGSTPLARLLHGPQTSETTSLVIALLMAGASPDTRDFQGMTPRDIIKLKNNEEAAAVIAAQDARSAMIRAASMARPQSKARSE